MLRGVPGFRAGENRMDTIPFSMPFPMLDRNVGGLSNMFKSRKSETEAGGDAKIC